MIDLSRLPQLVRGIMKQPWSEGCDEAVVLDELRIVFLSSGMTGLEVFLGWTAEEVHDMWQAGVEGTDPHADPDHVIYAKE